jgi:hypothetical protein
MSEHDDRHARPDLPSTTAEFRAAPDASASTAQFQAFAAGQGAPRVRPGGDWPEQPWAGEIQQRSGRTTTITVAAIAAIAVIVTLLVVFA